MPQTRPNPVLARLVSERDRTNEAIDDVLAGVEEEDRDPSEAENQLLARHRQRLEQLEPQIVAMVGLEEQRQSSADARAALGRSAQTPSHQEEEEDDEDEDEGPESPWPTFARYARDALITRFDTIGSRVPQVREQARERLQRQAPANTTTAEIEGLLPPRHIAQLMDVIDRSRPLVQSARPVPLENGKLQWPRILQRPTVAKQAEEKTPGASQAMQVTIDTIDADTFLGSGDLSWQAINWSSPDALALWFDLAAEEYARQTEFDAGATLAAEVTATAEIPGATGAHTLEEWWQGFVGAAEAVYTASRVVPNTIWAAIDRFFEVMALMSPQGTAPAFTSTGQISMTALRGTITGGLNLVGTYGLASGTIVMGDQSAFLAGETPGAPVELRAVEPHIGGMEVGVIGAFKAKVFDPARFTKIVDAT